MATIYQANIGQLIANPDRAMATFASGLLRFDQTFTGLTSDESAHRAQINIGEIWPTDDTSPAVDGIYIHPKPQEIRDGAGFTQYKVSGYGRLSTDYVFDGYEIETISGEGGYEGDTELTLNVTMRRQVPRFLRVSTSSELSNESIAEIGDFTDAITPFDFGVSAIGSSGNAVTGQIPTLVSSGTGYKTYQASLFGTDYTFSLRDPSLITSATRAFGRFYEIEFRSQTVYGTFIFSAV